MVNLANEKYILFSGDWSSWWFLRDRTTVGTANFIMDSGYDSVANVATMHYIENVVKYNVLRGIIDISHFRFWKMTRYPSIVFFRALQEYETRFLFHMWNWEKRKVSKVKKCHFFTPKSRFLANFENENENFDFKFVFRRKSWYKGFFEIIFSINFWKKLKFRQISGFSLGHSGGKLKACGIFNFIWKLKNKLQILVEREKIR